MKHYVLTRSAYGPQWPLDANRRRLDLTRAVTARLMGRQTTQDWTWVVLLDPRDPLLDERRAVYEAAAPAFRPVLWTPDNPTSAPWDRHGQLFTGKLDTEQDRRAARTTIAATAYRVDWRADVPIDEAVLMTRLDDDDGLTLDSLARTRAKSARFTKRRVLMQPNGFRVWNGRYSKVSHTTNAMHTLFTPAGDTLSVYDYGHRHCERVAPVVTVDEQPGWLWVRHPDTISGWRQADIPVNRHLRALFPIDWAAL